MMAVGTAAYLVEHEVVVAEKEWKVEVAEETERDGEAWMMEVGAVGVLMEIVGTELWFQ